jgi:anti-sigma B factor antagonist
LPRSTVRPPDIDASALPRQHLYQGSAVRSPGTTHQGDMKVVPVGSEDEVPVAIAVDQPGEGPAVVKLSGEMDVANAGEVSACLNELIEAGADVVIDLSDLQFIDSTGLGVLVSAGGRARQGGQRIKLRAPGKNVASTLSMTGLDRVFTIEP